MKIELSAHAGFCFGVKRSVESVLNLLDEGRQVSTLGPVIHNPYVVEGLKQKGAKMADSPQNVQTETVVIASHGAAPWVYKELKEKGVSIVDVTCPLVEKIHQRVQAWAEMDKPIIIVGQRGHTEVEATRAWAGENAYIVYTKEEIQLLPRLENVLVVAQTTMQEQQFIDLLEALENKVEIGECFNSICGATKLRQSAARQLADRADVMLVIGAKQSANTNQLYETCKRICKRTYLIESSKDLAGVCLKGQDYVGITAGASTPDEIIKEVVTRMSELDKNLTNPTDEPVVEETASPEETAPVQETAAEEVAQAPTSIEEVVAQEDDEQQADTGADPEFASAFEKTLVSIRPGLTITGTVVQVTEDEVCVNIGYKSDGLVPRNQLSTDENPLEAFKIGDEIEVEVVKVNDGEGNVLLSQRNIVNRKTWDALVEKHENNEYIEGVGKSVVKGGLIVDVEGIRTFVPASQLSERYVEKIDQFVGKPMKLKVIEVDKQKRRLVGSRKAVLLEEGAAKKAEAWEKLEVGKIVHGVVRRLTDFGAFVDLGGVDGLIHITDLSWGRIKHPSSIVKPNQEVDVLVLALDHERERISLGLKQTKPKPWETASVNYPVGSIVEGRVVRIVPFGAFVELEPGLDGLVHISQVADVRIEKVEDRLKVDDIVRVLVLDVNPDTRRISLSIRQAADYGDETDLPDGDLALDDLPLDDDTLAPVTDMETSEVADEALIEAAAQEVAEAAAQEEAPAAEEAAVVEEEPAVEEAAEEPAEAPAEEESTEE